MAEQENMPIGEVSVQEEAPDIDVPAGGTAYEEQPPDSGSRQPRAAEQPQAAVPEECVQPSKMKAAAETMESISNALRQAATQLREDRRLRLAESTEKISQGMNSIAQSLRQLRRENMADQARQLVQRRPRLVLGAAVVGGWVLARIFCGGRRRK